MVQVVVSDACLREITNFLETFLKRLLAKSNFYEGFTEGKDLHEEALYYQ
jgi:hypothetical protein